MHSRSCEWYMIHIPFVSLVALVSVWYERSITKSSYWTSLHRESRKNRRDRPNNSPLGCECSRTSIWTLQVIPEVFNPIRQTDHRERWCPGSDIGHFLWRACHNQWSSCGRAQKLSGSHRNWWRGYWTYVRDRICRYFCESLHWSPDTGSVSKEGRRNIGAN